MNAVQKMLLNINPSKIKKTIELDRLEGLLQKSFGYNPVGVVTDSQDIESTSEMIGTDLSDYDALAIWEHEGEYIAVWGFNMWPNAYSGLDFIYGDSIKADRVKIDVPNWSVDMLGDEEFEIASGTMEDSTLTAKFEVWYDDDTTLGDGNSGFELSNSGSKDYIVAEIHHDDCPYDYLITHHTWKDVDGLVENDGLKPSEAAQKVMAHVDSDAERVKDYYDNEWQFVGLSVTLWVNDPNGDGYEIGSDSLGGVASDMDAQDYASQLIHEAVSQVEGDARLRHLCQYQ